MENILSSRPGPSYKVKRSMRTFGLIGPCESKDNMVIRDTLPRTSIKSTWLPVFKIGRTLLESIYVLLFIRKKTGKFSECMYVRQTR